MLFRNYKSQNSLCSRRSHGCHAGVRLVLRSLIGPLVNITTVLSDPASFISHGEALYQLILTVEAPRSEGDGKRICLNGRIELVPVVDGLCLPRFTG